MKFLSVCEVCLQTYYLDGDEVYTPPNMKIRRTPSKNPYIGTWGDWVLHIQSHCPMCRVQCPLNAMEDLQNHKDALKAENEEITKDNEVYDDDDED